MKWLIYLIICNCVPLIICAQSTYSGKVVDENNKPLPYANVVIRSLPDSTFIGGTVSDDNGLFSLEANQNGLLLQVSSVGYATLCKELTATDVGILQLSLETQLLDEVVVKADLPVTRMKGDAMVTNVENSVLSKAGSANDVLAKLPGITKKDDEYEVFGKGTPLIYINGRKLNDLSELEQLNAEEIKSVEVVRNPGARYDATVKAVVRIQTVKKKGEGFGFDVRSSYYQAENTDLIEQMNFNYRHHSLDVFGTLSYSRMDNLHGYEGVLEKKGTQAWMHELDGKDVSLYKKLNAKIGLNYQMGEGHSLGLQYQPNKVFTDTGDEKAGTRVWVDGQLFDNFRSQSVYDVDNDWGHELNAYYNGQLENVNIEFNADYFQNQSKQHTTVDEWSEAAENRSIHSVSDVENRLAAGKLVFSFPLAGGSFSVGSEVTYTHRNDDYLNKEDYVPTSYSKIEELNATGFAEYNRSFPWGDWALGVRYEHIKFDYFENDKRIDEQSRTFDNVFPTLSFSTRIGKVQTQLSYTAKTVRPAYSQLSNNVIYTDRYTYQKGNPTLRPTMIHDVSLSAVWRWMQFNMSYSRTKNWILYWGDLMEADGSLTMLNCRNWGESVPEFTAFLSVSPKIGCWTPMIGVGIQKQWLTIESFGEPFGMKSPLYMANFNNTIELPMGFLISLDANIQSKGAYQNIYMEHPSGSVNVSVRKTFLNEALSVELKGTDLFDTDRNYTHLYSGDYNLYLKERFYRREFAVTLRYKFNAAKSKYKGTGAGQDQKNRM